jgi:hypothetical protein
MRERFAGSLFADTREADTRELFAPCGRAYPVNVMLDAFAPTGAAEHAHHD